MEKLNIKKEAKRAMREEADALMAKYHLKVVHIRGQDPLTLAPTAKGGATVVYAKHAPNDRIIYVSVALVNHLDSYCRMVGRRLAAVYYDKGNRIALRVPKNMPVSSFLKRTFYTMVTE